MDLNLSLWSKRKMEIMKKKEIIPEEKENKTTVINPQEKIKKEIIITEKEKDNIEKQLIREEKPKKN